MKKILLGLFGVVAFAVLGIVGAAFTQPTEMHVERSAEMSASPEDIWPYVADLRGFTEWSPWKELDPELLAEFSDPSAGVGAWWSWQGDENVGSGKMSITAVEEHRLVVEDLEFIEPMASLAEVRFQLEPAGNGTKVTWTMHGPNSFMSRVAGLFMDMEAMIGADFEKGLDRLANLAERDAQARLEAEARAAEAEAEGDTGNEEAALDEEAATP